MIIDSTTAYGCISEEEDAIGYAPITLLMDPYAATIDADSFCTSSALQSSAPFTLHVMRLMLSIVDGRISCCEKEKAKISGSNRLNEIGSFSFLCSNGMLSDDCIP